MQNTGSSPRARLSEQRPDAKLHRELPLATKKLWALSRSAASGEIFATVAARPRS